MSSTNKKLIALLSAMIVVLVVIIILAVQLFSKGSSESDVYYVPGSVQDNTMQNATTNAATGTTVLGTETTAAGSTNAPQNQTTATTAPAVNTTQAPSADVSAMGSQQILDLLTNAVNQTKSYTGSVSVHHTESFEANVTQCTGGSLVAQVANSLIGMVVKPSDETLSFSGGTAVNSEGETVTMLLPQKGSFRLTMSGVSSISAYADGSNTVVNVTLVPESVGMYDVPAANAAGVGYLDVSSLDISILEVTGAAITYKGSTIKAVINPNGYVEYAEYTIPLNVEGSARSGVISGSATFDGKQTEIWDLNW